jgi:hypothetical protein
MKELKIIEIIGTPHAILHKFGEQVANEVRKYLSEGKQVTLSFEGLKGVTSGFAHASIGQLYADFGQDSIENLLTFTHVSKEIWKEKIEEAILLATNPAKAQEYNEIWQEALAN